jgi:H+/Cl- antiporter ClcA
MIERKENGITNFMLWLAYGLTGMGTGFVASLMVWLEETLTDWRKNMVDTIISAEGNSTNGIWVAYIYFAGFSLACTLVASCMTVYWAPASTGSGVAEIIAYMNGVNYPGIFGFATFATKAIGVVLAVVGGLTIGKEGPLGHIGANVGCFIPYLPFKDFNYLRNDANKRHLIAAGTSSGVAAAFGAPIGGTLFSYEMSMSNTFWKFSIIWKVFFSCALSCFSLAFWSALYNLKVGGWKGLLAVNSSVLKFGLSSDSVPPPSLKVMPAAFIVGATCGFLGAMFVVVNNMMGFWRKHYITK